MAFTAVAAIAGAGSVMAGIVAVETLATIALVTTVVGKITNSSELMKIGSGLGLASAGMGLISSATGGAAAVEATGTATMESLSNVPTAAGELSNVANTASNSGGILSNANSLVNSDTLDVASIANQPSSATIPRINESSIFESNANPPPATQLNTSNITAPSVETSTNLNVTAPTGATAPRTPTSPSAPDSPSSFFGDLGDKVGSTWNKATDWMEKNPKSFNSLLQIGGGLLTGAADSAKEKARLDQQQQQIDFQQNMIRQQQANMNSQPVIGNIVNPNYVRKGGIISNINSGK